MGRRRIITLWFLVLIGVLFFSFWLNRSTKPARFEVKLKDVRTMNIGEATGRGANNWDPVSFAVFTITNAGEERSLLAHCDTRVRDDANWQDIFLFRSSLNNTTLEPRQAMELNVQVPEDERLWRLQVDGYTEASFLKRCRFRLRDAWRSRTLTNLFRPWWSRRVVVTKSYKRQGTNLIEQF